MKLLALDTATEWCSVAVWLDGSVREREEAGARHSERVLALADEVLAESGIALASLDAIAFGRGPGSFTGLRIAAGVAQGLAFGAELPVVPVSTLAALAEGAAADRVLAAIDARMHQVYWGAYARNAQGRLALEGEEIVVAPGEAPLPAGREWVGTGSGWDVYASVLAARLGERVREWRSNAYPHARFIAALGAHDFAAGRAVAPEAALPVYIRDKVARKTSER